MRKILFLLLVIAALASAIPSQAASKTVKIDGVWYELSLTSKSADACVVAPQGEDCYAGDVIIPFDVTWIILLIVYMGTRKMPLSISPN